VVVKDEKGEPERILGVAQDITEQKEFAEELKKQVEAQTVELKKAHAVLLHTNLYFQHLINQFESALAALLPVYDGERIADFTFKMSIEAYSKYSSLSPEAIQGKRVSEVSPGYYQTDAFHRYVELYTSGQPQSWDVHYSVDELDVHMLITASKMGEEVVVNFTDVTNLKRLQLDMERKVEELQHLNSNLEEFTYAASHDLKEPIRKIHVFAVRLKQSLDKKMTAKEAEFLGRIEFVSRRMASLIEDLLVYSEADHQPLFEEVVDLNDVVHQVLMDLDLEIEQKKVSIHLDHLCTIKGNSRQLQQAFQNLISNALKYTKSGVLPLIRIRCDKVNGQQLSVPLRREDRSKNFYHLIVEDNGIGFEAEHADRIFHMFTRLHSHTAYSGTGIGLSIVRKVLTNHGRYVWAESTLGEGSVFHLLLPLAPVQRVTNIPA